MYVRLIFYIPLTGNIAVPMSFLFFRLFWSMEEKSSNQMGRLFTRCLPIAFTFLNDAAFTFGKSFETSEMVVCTCWMQFCFDNPAENFLTKARKFCAQNPRICIKVYFFRQVFFRQKVLLEETVLKNAFILLKDIFNKTGGRKICRC